MPDQKKRLQQLKTYRETIDRMIEFLEDPKNKKAPSDDEIRKLAKDIGDVAFVDGWGGGF